MRFSRLVLVGTLVGSLIAYSCNTRSPEIRISNSPKTNSLKTIVADVASESRVVKSFFQSDKQIKDSLETSIKKEYKHAWRTLTNEFPGFSKTLPKIEIRQGIAGKTDYDGAEYNPGVVTFRVGYKDSVNYLTKKLRKYGCDIPSVMENKIYLQFHELSHHLFIERSKNTGTYWWWGGNFKIKDDELFAYHLISEGVADYMTYKAMKKQNTLSKNLKEWDQDTAIIYKRLSFYEIGYELVQPIIDKFGINAFDYLATHPISAAETKDLVGYQNKILRELEKQTSR